ncbi:MAG: hypothetical protein JWL77_2591 [Chthonomonadaceae bacterium]|nr:hypothetical protein [Chthonomonadaceae bacterium]
MTLKKQSFRFTRRSAPLLTGLGLLALGWTVATPVRAQVVMNGPVLYSGDPSATSGVKLSSWGSGVITEDNKGVFGTGTMALRIVSHGLYQGASIQLAKAVDLGPYVDNKSAYLSFVVVPPAPPAPASTANSPYGGPGRGGSGPGIGASGGGSSFGAEGGGQSGFPGAGGYGGRGENGGLNSKPLTVKYQTPHAMQNIRVVLVTSSGRRLEMLLPLDSSVDDGPWKRVSIPISLIPGIKADDAQIKAVHLFGDSPGIMRVGNIGVIVDQTPITVDSLPNRDLARLATHEFRVVARGGITPLLITWDWDAADGIQDESQGKFVSHQFRKESGYDRDSNKILDNVVTVTVRDLYGIKKPVSTKFSIHVTP